MSCSGPNQHLCKGVLLVYMYIVWHAVFQMCPIDWNVYCTPMDLHICTCRCVDYLVLYTVLGVGGWHH